ncbi:MAG: alanine--tRNA ligase [Proteobacteria bacterium]|nr:alanine--tRNA ligase [Pseudomonadota bacterium]
MKIDEVRKVFLKYFEKNGHTIVPSSGLIPRKDPTLLFTNAGMNQFKDVFIGEDVRNYKRAVSCQKCLRAGGKHNDLENVGFTYRHHTFFEMLGNFSFGDYFKKDAIRFSWELLTKEYKIPVDRLYVSVFKEDDEAYDIWLKDIGIPKEKIFRMGEKDNFWSMGDTGPCGPCSEIFYDHGTGHGCKKPKCTIGCDCDRFVEIWNLVFMQFNRDEKGKLTKLPKPSIDTGAGLERLSAVMQGVASNYDIDLFKELKKEIEKEASIPLTNKKVESSYNVIADHLRSIAFLISDGCLPSNEGAGYVLRRIIRRAIRHGKIIGFESPFLYKKIGKVADIMGDAYPELIKTRKEIEKVVKIEEEKFFETLDKGLLILEKEISLVGSGKTLNGDIAFKLYDTYGFPLDLTEMLCKERGVTVDRDGFNKEMERQKDMARKGSSFSSKKEMSFDQDLLSKEIKAKNIKPTEFTGYDSTSSKAKCLYIIKNNEFVPNISSGDNAILIFNKTPFYAESGGQSCDAGLIKSGSTSVGQVTGVIKPLNGVYLHMIKANSKIDAGKEYDLEIDSRRRNLIKRNHTATHILHYLLRKHLGSHIKQSGSSVDSDMFSFDFNHYEAIPHDVICKIETEFNELILASDDVITEIMNYKDAVKSGAIALFDEKYDEKVRVVHVGNYSTELCGGTHVKNTSEIGVFIIESEFSIGSGFRRIEATTSIEAYKSLAGDSGLILSLINKTKSTREEFVDKIIRELDENKTLRKEIEKIKSGSAKNIIDELIKNAKSIKSVKFIYAQLGELGAKELRESAEYIKNQLNNVAMVIYADSENKISVVTAVSKSLTSKIMANEIMKIISAEAGAKGGGTADFAQGGGGDISKLKSLEKKIEALIIDKTGE